MTTFMTTYLTIYCHLTTYLTVMTHLTTYLTTYLTLPSNHAYAQQPDNLSDLTIHLTTY